VGASVIDGGARSVGDGVGFAESEIRVVDGARLPVSFDVVVVVAPVLLRLRRRIPEGLLPGGSNSVVASDSSSDPSADAHQNSAHKSVTLINSFCRDIRNNSDYNAIITNGHQAKNLRTANGVMTFPHHLSIQNGTPSQHLFPTQMQNNLKKISRKFQNKTNAAPHINLFE